MALLSKVHKPYNFASHNTLKLSFTNIRALYSSFDGYESLLKANSPRILTYFMTPFYGWSSNASRIEACQGDSLLFITKYQEIPCTHFIKLGRLES